jgi:hypothetical protein
VRPERIQLRRTKGWRKPEGAIVVSRPSKWGNPYTPDTYRAFDCYADDTDYELRSMAVSDFRGLVEGRWDKFDDTPEYPSVEEIQRELRGHDLCCWCPDELCHATVLLEIANGEIGAT